jgi:hypothetical protein
MAPNYKVLISEIDGANLKEYTELTLQADNVNFDNSTNGFTSDDVQGAIEESAGAIDDGASSGFVFGKNGTAPSETWLVNNDVPSNMVGIPISFDNGFVDRVIVRNSDAASIFDVEIYEHDGTTFNLVTTVSVSSSRGNIAENINYSTTKGKELAAKISSGTARNPKVSVIVKGTT